MKRKMYDTLLAWKERSRGQSAALIQGAPRVGKSFVAEEFAKKEYGSFIRIDFSTAGKAVRDMFLYDLDDLDTFFLKLEVLYRTKLQTRNAVILLEQVQWFPQVRNAINTLVADGRHDYIETGALLSIKENLKGVTDVSREERFKMFPMDYEEFLWATGNDTLMDQLRSCFEERRSLSRSLHRQAMNAFRQYLIVGGMPQSVAEYVDTMDFHRVDKVKRKILDFYREGIAKYAKRHRLKVQAIFEEVPSQLKNRNQHFRFSDLKKGGRYSEYQEPLFWLEEAMLLHCCHNATDPGLGLDLPQERTMLKCYMADTGLLISHAYDEKAIEEEAIYEKVLLGNLEESMGLVLENIVAQMLAASGHKLYFYANADRERKENRMEVDFLVTKQREDGQTGVAPIKVKSGKNYKRSSLRKFMAKFGEKLHITYDLHTGNAKEEEGITYLPLYMAGLI